MDLNSNKIATLPALTQERSGHASVFFDGMIFVAGGQSKQKTTFFDSIEKYVLFSWSHFISFFDFVIFLFYSFRSKTRLENRSLGNM